MPLSYTHMHMHSPIALYVYSSFKMSMETVTARHAYIFI